MRACCLLLLLTAAAAAVHAETAYVTDMLRLGLHRAADTSDSPFQTLLSGTALEILERTTFYARVRTPDGAEGWVKSAYLVEEPPARARLNELEAEAERLRKSESAAAAARAAAEAEAAKLAKQMASSVAESESAAALLARLERENAAYAERLDGEGVRVPLKWAAAALALALAAGFAAGIWWLDALIRRRHGGFRVY